MSNLSNLVIDENNMVFDPITGTSYQINESAKEILNLLKKGFSKEKIIEELSKIYDIPKEELFIDINDFLRKLQILGIDYENSN